MSETKLDAKQFIIAKIFAIIAKIFAIIAKIRYHSEFFFFEK